MVVAFLWRRADPIDLTTAVLLAFMVVTPRMGAQYLLWFMPFLIARPTRFAWLAVIGASFWAGYGYIYMTQYRGAEWGSLHVVWAKASIVFIPILTMAMPWGRRVSKAYAEPEGTPPQAPSPLLSEYPASRRGALA